jgi:hypothetical protein
MLAHLETVVLIKEAIQLGFFRLVEYLEDQLLWVRLQDQNGHKQRPFFWNSFWQMKAIPCEKLPTNVRSRTTLCTTPFTEHRKLALNQNRKRSTLVSSFRNRCLTSLQLAVSLNSTLKTVVSTSTVKGFWDSGLLGRVPLSSVCSFANLNLLNQPVQDMAFFCNSA